MKNVATFAAALLLATAERLPSTLADVHRLTLASRRGKCPVRWGERCRTCDHTPVDRKLPPGHRSPAAGIAMTQCKEEFVFDWAYANRACHDDVGNCRRVEAAPVPWDEAKAQMDNGSEVVASGQLRPPTRH